MSPVRGDSNAGMPQMPDDDDAEERAARASAAFDRAGRNDDPEATPDVFDAPIDELKEQLSDMTRSLGRLLDTDAPDSADTAASAAPSADLADVDTDRGLTARAADLDLRSDDDDSLSAADRVALSLGSDDEAGDEAGDDGADDEVFSAAPEAPDDALGEADLLGTRVLQANLDGDLDDDNILDKFEDDLPADTGPDDEGDGGLEFASLDFDGD